MCPSAAVLRKDGTLNTKAVLADRLSEWATIAQRHGIRVPSFLSARIRSVFARRLSPDTDLEDWTQPIVGERGTASQHWMCDDPMEETLSSGTVTVDMAKVPSAGREQLRCVLVTGSLDVGGMEEVVAQLARLLPEKGVATAVLHAIPDSYSGKASLGRLGLFLSQQHHVDVAALGRIEGESWLRSQAPDVISAHSAPSWVLKWARDHKIPYVENLHGMQSMYGIDWRSEMLRSRYLAGVVTVSDLVRRQYLDNNPEFPSSCCLTIPNGVDEARRRPGDRSRARMELGLTGEYLFICLARFSLQKNTYALVDAFYDVARAFPQAHLVIAGRPDEPLYLRHIRVLRDRLVLQDRVHLRDHISDPGKLLAAGDGFVLNSFFEGWSLASMEALYAGLPVVLSEVGGALDQVGGRRTPRGLVVNNPLGDPLQVGWESMRAARFVKQINRQDLVAAMSVLVEERGHWARMRKELAAESAHRFGLDATVRAHASALYRAARTGLISISERPRHPAPSIGLNHDPKGQRQSRSRR